jgi:hypothetical protein
LPGLKSEKFLSRSDEKYESYDPIYEGRTEETCHDKKNGLPNETNNNKKKPNVFLQNKRLIAMVLSVYILF